MPVRVVNARRLTTPEQRRSVVYVGRSFAGWPAHPLANPFPLRRGEDTPANRAACLAKYCDWLAKRPSLPDDLARLWEECRHGERPLACWCCDWGGDTLPAPDCHAVVLARMLSGYDPAGADEPGA